MKSISTLLYTTHLRTYSETLVTQALNTPKCMNRNTKSRPGYRGYSIPTYRIRQNKDSVICSTSKAMWAAKLRRLVLVLSSTISLSSCWDCFSASFPISIIASTAEMYIEKNQLLGPFLFGWVFFQLKQWEGVKFHCFNKVLDTTYERL